MGRIKDMYDSGDKNAGWRECCEIDLDDSNSEVLKDVLGVCESAANRCVQNLTILHSRLLTLGYEFADPNNAFSLADTDQTQRIRDFEVRNGQLPIFLRSIYAKVRSVDFSQSFDQLSNKSNHPLRGLGWHARLVINSLEKAEEEWQQMVYEGSHDLSAGKRFFLWLGASDSNEEPVGYELPSPLVDEVISWDDEEEDLRGLLKKCFSWGGFPVYRFYPDGKHPAGVLYGQPDLPSFLPFLLDGLLEI